MKREVKYTLDSTITRGATILIAHLLYIRIALTADIIPHSLPLKTAEVSKKLEMGSQKSTGSIVNNQSSEIESGQISFI